MFELRDDDIAKGGITSVTKTKSLIETAMNGSIEEYYTSSWEQERYAEHRYEDAIPSWRKTCLPEVARPASWNNGYEESVTGIQSVVTNCQSGWSKVDMGVCSSSRDPGSAWNPGQYGDLSHRDRMRWDMAYFEGEERMGERYDYQLSSNGFQDFEMTAQFRSVSILGINSPAANIRNLNDSGSPVKRKAFLSSERSGEEKKALEARHTESSTTMKGATGTKRIQRDTTTMENECPGGLTSSYTSDVFDDHEHENLGLNRGKPCLKDKDYGISNDEEEQSQTSAYGFTTSTNMQTSMDNNFEKDAMSSWDPEKFKTYSRTSLELTPDVEDHGGEEDVLTVRDVPVVSLAAEGNESVEEQGTESSWNLYLEESEENRGDNSESENLGEDTPSCKCILGLKYDLESLEESTQSRDEMDSHANGDHHHQTVVSLSEVPRRSIMTPEIDKMEPLNSAQSDDRSCE
jgi:hypothetical protein